MRGSRQLPDTVPVEFPVRYPRLHTASAQVVCFPQSQYDGWQTFYKEGSEDGARLAKTIQENLNKTIQKENNRIAKTIDKIYIIKHVEIPTTIVECGFLSNPDEEKLLLEDEYQNKLAWGIYNGIIDYFYQ